VDTVRLVGGRSTAVVLDPEGVLPMWNGGHEGIQGLHLEALNEADLTGPFLALAPGYLDRNPRDARVRGLLVRRLFELGRYEAAIDLTDTSTTCDSRDSCGTLLYHARALHAVGRVPRQPACSRGRHGGGSIRAGRRMGTGARRDRPVVRREGGQGGWADGRTGGPR
jgi:hypothetical protein